MGKTVKVLVLLVIISYASFGHALERELLKENALYSFNNELKWDWVDKTLFSSNITLNVIDCGQTLDIFKNQDRYWEKNRSIDYLVKKGGKITVPLFFIAFTYAQYWIADHLKPLPRKIFLVGINCLQYDNTRKNYKIGLKINF